MPAVRGTDKKDESGRAGDKVLREMPEIEIKYINYKFKIITAIAGSRPL